MKNAQGVKNKSLILFIIDFTCGLGYQNYQNKQSQAKVMKNKNYYHLEPRPLTLNIINLQGLRLCSHQNSHRDNVHRSKDKKIGARELKHQGTNRQLSNNKIYFKDIKLEDDESFFSDYQFKLGSGSRLPSFKAKNTNLQKIKLNVSSCNSQSEKNNCIPEITLIKKSETPIPPQKIIESSSKAKSQSKTNEKTHLSQQATETKRKSFSKMEQRRWAPTIKMTFSFKNYKKISVKQQGKRELDEDENNRLDGWAVAQSPTIFEAGRKMDIVEYTDVGQQEALNESQRRKKQNQNRKYVRMQKVRLSNIESKY